MLLMCQEVAAGARIMAGKGLHLPGSRPLAAPSLPWRAPQDCPGGRLCPCGWTQSFTKPHLEHCCGQPPAWTPRNPEMGPHTLWTSSAPYLTPRSPGLGPCTPWMSVTLCSDPWEPRVEPLHPMDTCSSLPGPLGAQGWAPTSGRVLQLPHQQLHGSRWRPLGPTASRPPGPPILGAGSPPP